MRSDELGLRALLTGMPDPATPGHRALLPGPGVGSIPLVAILPLLILILILAGDPVSAEPAPDAFPGIIGEDDRRIVDSTSWPWIAVGQINAAAYTTRNECTGTLIGPRLVVTAAHCLASPLLDENRFPAGSIHFVVGMNRGDYVDHARAACVRYVPGYSHASPQSGMPPSNRRKDVAVLVLDKEVQTKPVPVAIVSQVDVGHALVHASYPRDWRYVLTADSTCRLLGERDGLWLTDCDTNFGSSGGPVFIEKDGALFLAAIMVAGKRGRHTIAVPVRNWLALATTTACPDPATEGE